MSEQNAVAWQYRHIDPIEGPGLWCDCTAENVALFQARGERYETRALYAEPSIDVLQRAYWLGWRNSAAWADRKDLWADRDSPAYTQERDDDLGTLAAAVKLGKE